MFLQVRLLQCTSDKTVLLLERETSMSNVGILALVVIVMIILFSYYTPKIRRLEEQLKDERERNRKLWLALVRDPAIPAAIQRIVFAAYPDGDE